MFNRRKSDQEIIAIICDGNEKEKRVIETYLYEDYFISLLHSRSAKSKCPISEDRKEAYSLAFEKFIKAIQQERYVYKGKGKLKKFFNKIYLDTCVDRFRKRKTKDGIINEPNNIEWEDKVKTLPNLRYEDILEKVNKQDFDDPNTIIAIFVDYFSKLDIEHLAERLILSPACLELIRLLLKEDFDYRRVAEIRGSNYNSIKASFHNCKKRITQNLF